MARLGTEGAHFRISYLLNRLINLNVFGGLCQGSIASNGQKNQDVLLFCKFRFFPEF